MNRFDVLLAAVADRPEGERVNLSALVRAFTPTVTQVARAIEQLIAEGRLDARTLRRPVCVVDVSRAPTLEKLLSETPVHRDSEAPTKPAAPKPVDEGEGAARHAVAPSPTVTGAQLVAEIEEFLERCPEISKTLFCDYVFNSKSAMWKLGRRKAVGAEVVKRIRDTIAEPPASLQRQREARNKPHDHRGVTEVVLKPLYGQEAALVPFARSPAAPVASKVNKPPRPRRAAPCASSNEKLQFQRQAQQAMRTNRKAAEAFLDSGKSSSDATSVSMKIEARKVEVRRAEEARLADPIEQAKIYIRRRTGKAVFGAEVTLGEKGKGKFVVGLITMSQKEMLDYASKLRARG